MALSQIQYRDWSEAYILTISVNQRKRLKVDVKVQSSFSLLNKILLSEVE